MKRLAGFVGSKRVVLSPSLVSFTSYVHMYVSVQYINTENKGKGTLQLPLLVEPVCISSDGCCVTDAQLVDQLHRKEGSFFFD